MGRKPYTNDETVWGIRIFCSRSILRMVQKDLMEVRKIGNKSYYSFTPQGKRQIDEGVKRVYGIRRSTWDGQWRILTYSFPEAKREIRNEIRKELTWTGFGPISNSTWISPNPIEAQVIELMERFQIEEHMTLFSSSSVVSHDDQNIIDRAWDWEQLSKAYEALLSSIPRNLRFCVKKP
nr:hypothetical protein [Thalassobacillus sp. C254]